MIQSLFKPKKKFQKERLYILESVIEKSETGGKFGALEKLVNKVGSIRLSIKSDCPLYIFLELFRNRIDELFG